MKTITFKAIEFDNADEAIQWTFASGRGKTVRLGGRHYVIERDEAERLAAEGVEFAYLFDHDLPDGRNIIVSVPVN